MFQGKRFVAAVLLLSGFFISGYNCNADILENVLMPDALVIGRVNLTKIHQSSIAKLIKKDETASVNEMNAVLEKYNLSDKDFTSFVIGVKLNAEKIKDVKTALQNDEGKEYVFGVQTSKPVSFDQLKNILIDSYKQDDENNIDIKIKEKDGIKLLLIKDKDSVQTLTLTVLEKEKIIIGGDSSETVISSIHRIKTGENIVFGAELVKLKSKVSKKADFYLIGYLPEAIRDEVGLTRKKTTAGNAQNNGINVEVLKDINALSIQADFTNELDVDILSYFKNRKSAEDTKRLFNQFLPMVLFIVMSSTQGVSLPVLDSINCEVSKVKPELKLTLTLTEKDVEAIQKMVKKNKNQPKPNQTY
jgi:hypothetical protein